MAEKKMIKKFIDSLSDGKLSGWRDKEYTIADDRKLGYRIDHQGTNKNAATKKHRIYIQNCKGGKSKYSNQPAKKILARSTVMTLKTRTRSVMVSRRVLIQKF